MTPVRNLSSIWPVVFVGIMVCYLGYVIDKADKAAAHRQCARNADALKSDEGE